MSNIDPVVSMESCLTFGFFVSLLEDEQETRKRHTIRSLNSFINEHFKS